MRRVAQLALALLVAVVVLIVVGPHPSEAPRIDPAMRYINGYEKP